MNSETHVTEVLEGPLWETRLPWQFSVLWGINRGSTRALPHREKLEKVVEMRALECECGQHLEASNDEELFEKVREHVDREHHEKELDDSQVRAIVARRAYGYY